MTVPVERYLGDRVPGDELLRPADVEARYGISVSTLATWRWETDHDNPVGPRSFKAGPRRVVYRRSVVEAWIAECESVAS